MLFQRTESYCDLIDILLGCKTSTEVDQVLHTYLHLIDNGLVRTLKEVAGIREKSGDMNRAGFLYFIADSLSPLLIPEAPSTPYAFFEEVLLATWTSNADPQVVCPLFQANLEHLNQDLVPLWKVWVESTLLGTDLNQKRIVARLVIDFCELVARFPRGSKADNLEIAIAGYEIALGDCHIGATGSLWAAAQSGLGIAYGNRVHGDKAENLEKALVASQKALSFYKKDTSSQEWAAVQNNLALAYIARIREDQAENLEKAIIACEASLEVYTFATTPDAWAASQHNLGLAYMERIWGDPAKNTELAIAACKKALHVRTYERLPFDWAMTQNLLGTAYSRLQDEKAESLELAIAAYQTTLAVYTLNAYPREWAMVHHNLGIAYSSRKRGNQAENLELSVIAFKAALLVYTHESLPFDWAKVQNALSISYREQGNISGSLVCCKAALEVYTPEHLPLECFASGYNLGHTAFIAGLWSQSIEGFAYAIDSLERILTWTKVESRRTEMQSKAFFVYEEMVQALISAGHFDKAIEYVERSKLRRLVEAFANRDRIPNGNVSQSALSQFQRMRRDLAQEQSYLSTIASNSYRLDDYKLQSLELSESRARLNQLQQQLNELIATEIQPFDPDFNLTYNFEAISFEQIRQLLPNDQTVLVEWFIAVDRFLILIVTRQDLTPIVWQSSIQDIKALDDWNNTYLTLYNEDKTQWRIDFDDRLKELADILHIDYLLSLIPEHCSQLILVPHRWLHLMPLHILPLANGSSLLSRFTDGVSFAPSCQLLKISQNQERTQFQNLFAIQNPTEDLIYADLEVASITSFFPKTQVLPGKFATKAELKANQSLRFAHCTHFSCHGVFNFELPLESFLLLAPDGSDTHAQNFYLTLKEIFELDLSQCRLVTLSACETGLTDFTVLGDEYIGLPSGFLYAGSSSIVSSLWAVNDLSTTFLMIKFYENLRQYSQIQAGTIAIALNQAQKWLRYLTIEEFEKLLETLKPHLDSALAQLRPGQYSIFQESLKQIRQRQPYPFAHPYYWAAFTATGL